MNKLIVDLEATCCADDSFPRHEMETIEIGAVMVNKNLDIIGEYSTFIKPVRNPNLTEFCKKLTTITQEDVDSAPSYEEAIKDFQIWMADYDCYEFCSWGDFDRKLLERDDDYHGLKPSITTKHINIKKLFASQQGIKKPCGVSKALGRAGLKFEGTQHRGIDDARNMARLSPFIFGDIKVV